MVVKRWELREVDQTAAQKIATGLGISMITAQILVNRGIATLEEAESFFRLNVEDLHDPFLLFGMDQAVDRLITGFQQGERMVIFGDYDVDGITGTSTLYRVLKKIGARVDYYIPDRSEGYGLNVDAVQRLAQAGYTLILTVDNGISCYEQVEVANSLGVDVIITDHHEPPEVLPNALAVINPKLECCTYPTPELAGVGVGFKLCQALAQRLNMPNLARYVLYQLDLVTLGTIADIVPLVGENRIIAANGLRLMEKTRNLGLEELIKVVGLDDRQINAGHIAFGLGPRINAIGRIDDPRLGVELLITNDPERAKELAEKMDQANRKRQMVEEKIMKQAVEMIEKDRLQENYGIILASTEWPAGVIGIVASKLVEKYYRPIILIAIQEDGVGKGSARGIRGIHLYEALTHCSEFLLGFGGHEMAAGLSLASDQIEAFREAFVRYAEGVLTPDDLVPYLKIDLEVEMEQLSFNLLNELERLEPHGMGNAKPVLAVRKMVHQHRLVGSLEEHLKIQVSNGKKKLDGIGFQMSDKVPELQANQKIDLVFALERNVWQGRESLQMMVKDLKGSQTSYIEELYEQAEMTLFRPDDRWFTAEESSKGVENRQRLQSIHSKEEMLQQLAQILGQSNILKDGDYTDAMDQELLQALDNGQNILRISGNPLQQTLEIGMYALYQRIQNKHVTCILYPHRSMVQNQYQLLKRWIPELGMRIYRTSGLLTFQEEREQAQALEQGEVDLLLTTPEYLEVYLDKFKLLRESIRFLVVEEMDQFGVFSKDYISNLSARLHQPQILATTSLVSEEQIQKLVECFELDQVLVAAGSSSSQELKLQMVDRRNLKNKEGYLIKLLLREEKTFICVDSPRASIALAEKLRHQLPGLEEKILFYHECLTCQEQQQIMTDFRQGKILALVTTSAFGLNHIPDIRHGVIYHLTTHYRELAQLMALVAQDGEKGWVHLLYGDQDLELALARMERVGPKRDSLVKVYILLQKLASGQGEVRLSLQKLAQTFGEEQETALIGLKVFQELGLLELEEERGQLVVKLLPKPKQKLDLYSSIRYNEGILDKKYFDEFCQMAFTKNAESLVVGLVSSPLPERYIFKEV